MQNNQQLLNVWHFIVFDTVCLPDTTTTASHFKSNYFQKPQSLAKLSACLYTLLILHIYFTLLPLKTYLVIRIITQKQLFRRITDKTMPKCLSKI